jgi:hypothetical protein
VSQSHVFNLFDRTGSNSVCILTHMSVMMVNNELERIWEEVAKAYHKLLSWYLQGAAKQPRRTRVQAVNAPTDPEPLYSMYLACPCRKTCPTISETMFVICGGYLTSVGP